MRDHSGQCPVQYLENIGPATEQSDWLILVIGAPLNYLSRVIIIKQYLRSILDISALDGAKHKPGAAMRNRAPQKKHYHVCNIFPSVTDSSKSDPCFEA